jgi:hypothetical protein
MLNITRVFHFSLKFLLEIFFSSTDIRDHAALNEMREEM